MFAQTQGQSILEIAESKFFAPLLLPSICPTNTKLDQPEKVQFDPIGLLSKLYTTSALDLEHIL